MSSSSRRRPPRRWAARATLLCLSVFAALAAGEAALRVVRPDRAWLYVNPPNATSVFRPSPGVMPGVEGESRFITNSDGVRGDELTADFTYRILAVGGSTTECLYLDQGEAWPQLLQRGLNEGRRGRRVWVGNAGKSGLDSRDHVVGLGRMLDQYRNIDAVIILVGVNDLLSRLKWDAAYDPDFLGRAGAEQVLLKRCFSNYEGGPLPLYRRTAVWGLVRDAKARLFPAPESKLEQDDAGKAYATWREHRRRAAAIRRALPDLSTALAEYARNINTLIDVARSRAARPIFVTQPAMWRDDLPPQLEDLLWTGGLGEYMKEPGKEYYSAGALEAGMRLYNETLIRTCRERGAEYVDLAPLVPRDTGAFYDDVHYNEAGARLVAEVIRRHLTEEAPRP